MSASLHWLTMRPIAHRGLHDKAKGVIENTAEAALAAIAGNFAIECDVQITADGEAVVFHDFTLERLTEGTGRVDAMGAKALTRVAMHGTTDHIITLQDWLGVVAGRSAVVIEVKSGFAGDMRLTRRAAEIAKAYDGPLVLKSFDPKVLRTLREIAPEIPRGIVAMDAYEYSDYLGLSVVEKHALANLLHFSETKPDFISWRVGDLPSAAPFLCRTQLGLPVMAWTVRTAEERELARLHSDQMVFEGFRP
ncbi:Glycerophosphoryl diester phosphodiesterase [Rhizobiales bacterium GAS188]|nr:Glycerophosphoryl diester phosphodiesterase [Rhizobiales bacterium GAS188]